MAGVPPDYFSETGQLWGNPVYNWEKLAETDFAWWIQRFKATLQYVDIVRIDHFRERFSGHARRRLESHLPVKPGAVEMLDFLAGRGLRLAVATGSGRLTAERHLGRAGLIDRFAAVATRDDVENAKPAPDVYLEAARRLGVAPERCIAFEDSNVGLTAAHAAGTMAFMVPDILPPLPEVRAKCLRVFDDLHAARLMLEESL
jgi:HAD superfamily hydrolase (TIGR01509 family)